LLEGDAKLFRKFLLAHADHGSIQPNAVPNESINIIGFPACGFPQGAGKVLFGPRDIRHGNPFCETPPKKAGCVEH
jgi:hypothetical protein